VLEVWQAYQVARNRRHEPGGPKAVGESLRRLCKLTVDVYGHLIPGLDKQAVDKLDDTSLSEDSNAGNPPDAPARGSETVAPEGLPARKLS
jgi:hypothetical protein